MSERGIQTHFDLEPPSENGATHIIFPGASIKVKTLTSSYYAWTVVVDNAFEAQIQPKDEEPHHERRMRYFIAKQGFTAYYRKYDKRVPYPVDTCFYAFAKNEDGMVAPIPRVKGK